MLKQLEWEQTDTQTHRHDNYSNPRACAPRVNYVCVQWMKALLPLSVQLGIKKMTPDGLLLGATSIVSQNKQLRKELNDLEREIALLRHQNRTMVGATISLSINLSLLISFLFSLSVFSLCFCVYTILCVY